MIVVRPLQDADQASVRALDDRAMADERAAEPDRRMDSGDLRRTLERQLAILVAVDSDSDDEVVGMIALRQPDEDTPATLLEGRTRIGELVSMRVSPDRQRLGIGAKLIRTLIDWGKAAQLDAIIVNATPSRIAAMGLYRSVGFHEAAPSMRDGRELLWFELDLQSD